MIEIKKIEISDIMINQNARAGCKSCPIDRKKDCQLEFFEHQKSIKESVDFIHSFDSALLLIGPVIDDKDIDSIVELWKEQQRIEDNFSLDYDYFTFKFPYKCPMCQSCTLHEGYCSDKRHYRVMHETYNINMGDMLRALFPNKSYKNVYSLILIKAKETKQ